MTSAEELLQRVDNLERRHSATIDSVNNRLLVIERLVWIAVGGVGIIAAISGIGISLVLKQGDHIQDVSLRQAAAIAERKANEAAMKADIERLRPGR